MELERVSPYSTLSNKRSIGSESRAMAHRCQEFLSVLAEWRAGRRVVEIVGDVVVGGWSDFALFVAGEVLEWAIVMV